jgi:tripartite-type tricarboxylate transporter receptor subunit TctC
VVSAGRRAALASLLAAPAIARAQPRIVRLVLGFPPGGSADFLGRAMAERLG